MNTIDRMRAFAAIENAAMKRSLCKSDVKHIAPYFPCYDPEGVAREMAESGRPYAEIQRVTGLRSDRLSEIKKGTK